MPVADNKYNQIKGSKWVYNDRIEWFLKDIFNDVNNNYYKWFDNNIEKLDTETIYAGIKSCCPTCTNVLAVSIL